jgi:pyrimidine operon attenuation protein/uracil phosphoribosyltransferase
MENGWTTMTNGNLETTNLMLGIMAAVSVLEALVLIGIAIGGFMMYRRVMQLVTDLETRQIAPLREKVDAILLDVKAVTARVSEQTERVDHAITDTMGRVDDTATRVTSSVREKVNQATGVVRGIRAVLVSLLGGDSREEPPAPAAGRF